MGRSLGSFFSESRIETLAVSKPLHEASAQDLAIHQLVCLCATLRAGTSAARLGCVMVCCCCVKAGILTIFPDAGGSACQAHKGQRNHRVISEFQHDSQVPPDSLVWAGSPKRSTSELHTLKRVYIAWLSGDAEALEIQDRYEYLTGVPETFQGLADLHTSTRVLCKALRPTNTCCLSKQGSDELRTSLTRSTTSPHPRRLQEVLLSRGPVRPRGALLSGRLVSLPALRRK